MTLTIKHVSQQYAAQTWPSVEGFIGAAQQFDGGDYTLDQIKMLVNSGQWMLLVAVDANEVIHGAATINFMTYPNDRIAFITYIGGRLISNKDTFAQLKDILKRCGATKIQGAARESIARLWSRYGFKERYITVEAIL